MERSDSGSPPSRRVVVDERNVHSFRVPHRTVSSTRAQPRVEGPTQHQIAARLKSILSDAVSYICGSPADAVSAAEQFTALLEEAAKDIRQARIDSRMRRNRGDTSLESVEESPPKRSLRQSSRHIDPFDGERRREPSMPRTAAKEPDRIPADERLAEAEARRRLLAAERLQRLESRSERMADARARREAADASVREQTEVKMQRAVSARSREVERKKEFPEKQAAKSAEVQFLRQVESENKALDLEERHREVEKNAEAKAQTRAIAAKERAEARDQVASRAKSVERTRHEAHRSRAQAKEEQVQRHEEERRRETQERAQRSEERRERVHELQARAQAEAEARQNRAAERLEHSEKVRGELASRLRERSEKQDVKLREARERRCKASHTTRLGEVLTERDATWATEAQETLKRCVALSLRHAKPFLDELSIPPSAAKSKARALIARIASGQSQPAQYRQPLHELHHAIDAMGAADIAVLRSAHGLPLLLDLWASGRHDHATVRLLAETVARFLAHSAGSQDNVTFFVRSGCVGKLLEVIDADVRKMVQRGNRGSIAFGLALFALYTAAQHVLDEKRSTPELQSHRLVIFDAFEALDLENVLLSLATVATSDDLLVLQWGLALLRCVREAPRPQQCRPSQTDPDRACHALMGCIANMMMPGGQYLRTETPLTPAATGVLFAGLRLLNDIARRELALVQRLVGHPGSSSVFSHVVTAVSSYVAARHADFEQIQQEHEAISAGASASFVDAARAGITFDRFPIDDPMAKRHVYLRAAFHELLLLVGYVSVNNRTVQDCFGYGQGSPLLRHVIAALPISYFGVSRHLAFPSLLAICYRHPENLRTLREEMDVDSLRTFLEVEIRSVPSPGNPQPERREVLSWADMLDDDDEEVADVSHDVRGPPANLAAELSRAGRRTAYAHFFRCQKRLERHLWEECLAQLQ